MEIIKFIQSNSLVYLLDRQVFSSKKLQKMQVMSGRIWLTIDGDKEDYFYERGETFIVPAGKHSVIQAIGKASFRVDG